MLSEIVNSLFITYLATEYHQFYNNKNHSKNRSHHYGNNNNREDHNRNIHEDVTDCNTLYGKSIIHRIYRIINSNWNDYEQVRRMTYIFIIVLFINLCDTNMKIGDTIHALFDMIRLHPIITKCIIVAWSYIFTLYCDCSYSIYVHNKQYHTTIVLSFWKEFIPKIIRHFLIVLPIYPIIAILISFIFLFVISFFEILHLSTSVLNGPIYYGTLYGPFSYIYYYVKRDIIKEYINQNHNTILPLQQQHHQPIMKRDSTIC